MLLLLFLMMVTMHDHQCVDWKLQLQHDCKWSIFVRFCSVHATAMMMIMMMVVAMILMPGFALVRHCNDEYDDLSMECCTAAGTKISRNIPGRAKNVKEEHNASMYIHTQYLTRVYWRRRACNSFCGSFIPFEQWGVFDYSVIGVFRDCCISFIPESAAHVEAVHM